MKPRHAADWRRIRTEAKKIWTSEKMGSRRLFDSCWREFRIGEAQGGFDTPETGADCMEHLDYLAAYKVNNPRSSFYIRGR